MVFVLHRTAMLRRAARLVTCAGSLIVMLSLPSFAAPDAGASLLEAYARATTQLTEALSDAARAGHEPPRLSDPKFAALIAAAFDERVPAQFDADDFAALSDKCQAGTVMLKSYLLWRMPQSMPATFTPEQLSRISANSLNYQDEIALGMRFSLACEIVQIAGADIFWKKLPDEQKTAVRKAGLKMMQHGLGGVYAGIVTTQSDPLKLANRQLVLDAALAHLDIASVNMDMENRRSLIEAIDSALAVKLFGKTRAPNCCASKMRGLARTVRIFARSDARRSLR